MCNFTSLAMRFEYLGIECPDADMQFEDYLEKYNNETPNKNKFSTEASESLRSSAKIHCVNTKALETAKKSLKNRSKTPRRPEKDLDIA